MNSTNVLFPIFAMVALVTFAVGHLARLRLRAWRRRQISIGYLKDFRSEEAPERVVVAARHFANLFEVPVLFYLACVLSYLTGTADTVLVALAWLYVLLRCVHSFIHLTSNHVRKRLFSFLASCLVLLAMWVVLAIRIG